MVMLHMLFEVRLCEVNCTRYLTRGLRELHDTHETSVRNGELEQLNSTNIPSREGM